ncbi:MAG: hypothetical protein KKB82_07070, partial [Candidatus Omnitrophica bacterium]|nr:hypothetical protein [Candidatus Omnitrophota bacterium]MBU1925663.1 hypothetical protein [Candidatus Omnitrophota bacterium]
MSLKNRFFGGRNLLFKLGIALLIFYNVTFLGPNVAVAQVKDGEGAQNAGKNAVTSLVGEIRKEMNALSMELTLTGQAYEYLKGQHEQLKGNFDLVNKELEEKNAQLRKDKTYYDQQLKDLGAEIAEKENQINTLNETFRQNSALLMKQSEQIKTSLQKTETENTRLSANNRDYEQKIKNFELQLQEQKDKIKELQKYKSDAEKLEQYRMQVKESGEKLKEAKNAIKALNEKIKEMNTAFETQISEKEDRVQKIKGQHAEALQETDRFQEKAKGYEVQILERDGKIETLRNALREGEVLLEQQQAKNEQVTQQLKAQNVKILEDTNLYTSKIKSYESQMQNKDKKIAELEQSRNQTDDTLKAKLADTGNQLQRLQAQYAKVLDQEKALNALIADYEDKLMLKGKELDLIKKSSEIAEKKLQDELARVRNQVTEQEKEAGNQLQRLQAQYAKVLDQEKALNALIADYEDKLMLKGKELDLI